jgi:hypothetical protein
MTEGWVKVDRSIRDTWIARKPEYIAVYMTIVWGVNYRASQMVAGGELITVEEGEMITSIRSLAERSGTSEKHVRTFLKHAHESGIIRSKKGTGWTHLKLMESNELAPPQFSEGHNPGTIRAQSGQHHKKERKKKEEEEGYNNVGGERALSRTPRPSLDEVRDYFVSQGSTAVEAQGFHDHFTSNGWKVGGKAAMKDWKAACRNWIRRSRTAGMPKANPEIAARTKPVGMPEQVVALYAKPVASDEERERIKQLFREKEA